MNLYYYRELQFNDIIYHFSIHNTHYQNHLASEAETYLISIYDDHVHRVKILCQSKVDLAGRHWPEKGYLCYGDVELQHQQR